MLSCCNEIHNMYMYGLLILPFCVAGHKFCSKAVIQSSPWLWPPLDSPDREIPGENPSGGELPLSAERSSQPEWPPLQPLSRAHSQTEAFLRKVGHISVAALQDLLALFVITHNTPTCECDNILWGRRYLHIYNQKFQSVKHDMNFVSLTGFTWIRILLNTLSTH